VNAPETLLELSELEEGVDVECKRAAGKDGRGELPRSFFETYAAMANTYGGVVYLGISQDGDALKVTGILDIPRVRKALWDGLNNPKQVSRNLLRDELVSVVSFGEHKVLKVQVPRASRQERPVHVGENPFDGTFRRNFEGDYRCDAEAVQRLIAEKVQDSRDQQILVGFDVADLDASTLKLYRQRFTVRHIDHPWSELDDREFLRNLGGYRVDRASGEQGLTLAGLLMFGQWRSIAEAVPFYFLDYQEQNSTDPDVRWTDRVVPDGTWSGNVFDFYRIVIPRLFEGLKVPFRLERGTERVDESLVHEALREALVNALIHADYSGRSAIRVVKRAELFEFRNPGLMRVPLQDAIEGGHSDCRNRCMQKMFQMVGLGDQAGSGVPKVYRGWRQQDWRRPELDESTVPSEHTVLRLRMLSLFPADAVHRLEQSMGDSFRGLSELGRLALVTVAVEGSATHARIKGMTDRHSRDVTLELGALVRRGFLRTEGATRNMTYYLPGQGSQGELFPVGSPTESSGSNGGNSGSNEGNSGSNEGNSGSNELTSPAGEPSGSSGAVGIPPAEWERLLALASPAREKRRLSPGAMTALIAALCVGRWLTLRELSVLLDRTERQLRTHVSRLVERSHLQLQFPHQPSHPQQAYQAAVRPPVSS
jgi:ATP-dependent DNA helicase RecG